MRKIFNKQTKEEWYFLLGDTDAKDAKTYILISPHFKSTKKAAKDNPKRAKVLNFLLTHWIR